MNPHLIWAVTLLLTVFSLIGLSIYRTPRTKRLDELKQQVTELLTLKFRVELLRDAMNESAKNTATTLNDYADRIRYLENGGDVDR